MRRHPDVPLHELSVDRLVDKFEYVRIVDGVLDFSNLSITHRRRTFRDTFVIACDSDTIRLSYRLLNVSLKPDAEERRTLRGAATRLRLKTTLSNWPADDGFPPAIVIAERAIDRIGSAGHFAIGPAVDFEDNELAQQIFDSVRILSTNARHSQDERIARGRAFRSLTLDDVFALRKHFLSHTRAERGRDTITSLPMQFSCRDQPSSALDVSVCNFSRSVSTTHSSSHTVFPLHRSSVSMTTSVTTITAIFCSSQSA